MNAQTAKRQRGAALIILVTVLVLGVAWFTVGALGKAPPTSAETEIETGEALRAGKQALLAYVAQYAARFDTAEPGQLPCPEALTLSSPGQSSPSCSASGIVVGRLPWKTLGVDQVRDGYGEPLWYVVRGFRNPPINFGTAGQLSLNGSTVVALIIAPGRPLNTGSLAGTPPAGCTKQDQIVVTRNVAPLNAANFIECGVASGSLSTPGDQTWTNDRAIAITAAEWADAVAPAVSDRIQRQVAPAMLDYYNTTSLATWGERFLPNASTFGFAPPATNNLCGNSGAREGMPPTATVASGLCSTAWSSGGASGLGSSLSFGGCTPTPADIRCDFISLLSGIFSPRINVVAPRVGYSFRYVDPSQITISINGGPPSPASTGSYTGFVSNWDGSGVMSFQVSFPFLTVASSVSIRVPNPSDALLADSRSAWYVNNGWDRYTYYGVSRAATFDPGFSICNPGGDVSGCLTVNGMPAPNNDKRLVLVLMGRALPGQTWGTTNPADYLEGNTIPGNATVGDRSYTDAVVSSTFNDRVAACPFKYQDGGGSTVTICN